MVGGLACDNDACAVVEAGGDVALANDVLAGGAAGVRHVIQRPRHAQGPTFRVGLLGWVGVR